MNPLDTKPSAPRLDDITGLHIDDVNRSLLSYTRSHYTPQIIIASIVTLGWEYLAFRYMAPFLLADHSSSSNGRGNAAIIILPFVLASSWYYRLRKKFEGALLGQFAASNGFTYTKAGTVDETYGTAFRPQGKKTVSDIISGRYGGQDLRLFLYDLTIGAGRSQRTYRNTVIEIDLAGSLPHLLLVAKKDVMLGSVLQTNFGETNKLTLEGEFNKDFTLIAPAANTIQALEVFAPDIMELIIDKSQGYDIEFVANRIYIYIDHYLATNDDLLAAFALAKRLIDKVQPIAGRLKNDTGILPVPVNLVDGRGNAGINADLARRSIIFAVAVFVPLSGIAIITLVTATQLETSHIKTYNPTYTPPEPAPTQPTPYTEAVTKLENEQRSLPADKSSGITIVADGQAALALAQTNTDKAYAEYFIALGYQRQMLYIQAVQYAKASYQDDPTGTLALGVLSVSYLDLKQPQLAYDNANLVVTAKPTRPYGYFLRAYAQYDLGHKKQALADIDQAIALAKTAIPADVAGYQDNRQQLADPSYAYLLLESQ